MLRLAEAIEIVSRLHDFNNWTDFNTEHHLDGLCYLLCAVHDSSLAFHCRWVSCTARDRERIISFLFPFFTSLCSSFWYRIIQSLLLRIDIISENGWLCSMYAQWFIRCILCWNMPIVQVIQAQFVFATATAHLPQWFWFVLLLLLPMRR